jgi:DNA-binding NarL/FixJ family response regulator
MPPTRILVVDDHPIVRRSICSILSQDPTLKVVCETVDGEGAVTKARELHPDLILLDISLPGISGFEAARQIRKVSPESRIIFLSQHNSVETVREALGIGGHGYVTKSDAAIELMQAIHTVRDGNRYVSQRIAKIQKRDGLAPETA